VVARGGDVIALGRRGSSSGGGGGGPPPGGGGRGPPAPPRGGGAGGARLAGARRGAAAAALAADLDVAALEALERKRRELAEAVARAAARARAVRGLEGGLADLLARLGPNGGRGCGIPDTLERTGQRFAGVASWYGWDFAGRPTASGAIFDPRLFTAAHRTLPLNSYLLVRHGDRCAKVLVNDRGPFIEGRVLDLSKGAADYLGVSLHHVEAEILAPT
jgi:hypothetical protein